MIRHVTSRIVCDVTDPAELVLAFAAADLLSPAPVGRLVVSYEARVAATTRARPVGPRNGSSTCAPAATRSPTGSARWPPPRSAS